MILNPNAIRHVWNSNLSRQIKLSFYATVEAVLLYGSKYWTLKPTLQKSLDGCYTRMLRAVLNISKTEHVTNNTLYEGIPRVSQKVADRRMRLAHTWATGGPRATCGPHHGLMWPTG